MLQLTVRTINDQDSVKFLANSFSLCSYFSIPDYFSIQCSSLHTGNFIVRKQLWSNMTNMTKQLGLNGTALSWCCSYLSVRTQQISVQGALSNVFYLRYGVPQGSCLGPLLFKMYSSKIFDIVGHHLPQINCYTDDSKLHLSFNPSYAFSQDEAIRSMETCISDV